eukprot:GFUD01119921.1.p1 GENE.GFUD01119921.1~~GFUD01119921.1.p1  ORF type:complete len:319 (+),score=60.49 GFUD01119921.1:47-1003(+)
MWSSPQNKTGMISATLAVVILWIFWPILSPTLMILNSIAFLPFILLFTFIGTIGEGVLFTISLGCFGLFVKDNIAKDGEKSSKLEDSEEANDILGAGTTKVDVIKEKIIQEDTSESKTEDYSEVLSVTDQVLKDIEDHEVLKENNVQDSSEPKPSDSSELSGVLVEVLEDAEEHDILAVKTTLIDLINENDVEEDTSESETSDYSELASVSNQVLTDVEDQEVNTDNNVQEDSSETNASCYSELSSVTEEVLKDAEENEAEPISDCNEVTDSNIAVQDILDVLDAIVEGIIEDDEVTSDQPTAVHLYGTAVGWNLQKA